MTGGTRFYSNCKRYLEGITAGIEHASDINLEAGNIEDVEGKPGYPFMLEITDHSGDEWYENHSYFQPDD